jgi:hypothetical protein
MWRAKRINGPSTIFPMSNQGTNADDRVVDVLGELVAHRGPNFIIALAEPLKDAELFATGVKMKGREAPGEVNQLGIAGKYLFATRLHARPVLPSVRAYHGRTVLSKT